MFTIIAALTVTTTSTLTTTVMVALTPTPACYCLQDVKAAVKGVQPAGTLAGRTANSIHWSPHGRNLVLAGLKARLRLHHGTLLSCRRRSWVEVSSVRILFLPSLMIG